MIVAPSAGAFMSTSLLGTTDFRTLSPYLQKPSSSVMMTFCELIRISACRLSDLPEPRSCSSRP